MRMTASVASRPKCGELVGNWALGFPAFRAALVCELRAIGLIGESLELRLPLQLLVRGTDEEQVL